MTNRPGWRERWWGRFGRVAYFLWCWAIRHETALRVRRALPRGTAVVLRPGHCSCAGEVAKHQGVWFVERYADDAGDYRLVRKLEPESVTQFLSLDESTFACSKSMEVTPAGNS